MNRLGAWYKANLVRRLGRIRTRRVRECTLYEILHDSIKHRTLFNCTLLAATLCLHGAHFSPFMCHPLSIYGAQEISEETASGRNVVNQCRLFQLFNCFRRIICLLWHLPTVVPTSTNGCLSAQLSRRSVVNDLAQLYAAYSRPFLCSLSLFSIPV